MQSLIIMMVDIPIRASYRCLMVACLHLRELQWNPIPRCDWELFLGNWRSHRHGRGGCNESDYSGAIYIKLSTREAVLHAYCAGSSYMQFKVRDGGRNACNQGWLSVWCARPWSPFKHLYEVDRWWCRSAMPSGAGTSCGCCGRCCAQH